MKRKFNFTGRRSIDRKDVRFVLHSMGSSLSFDADMRLGDYKFPHNAEIWVEAYRQNLWMQWQWGTISDLRVPANRNLIEFDVADGILFRIRVVHPPGQEKHKLIGEVDKIQPIKAGEEDDSRRPLLTPVPDELDQILWKLDFEQEPPRLLINKDAKPSWKELALSPYFKAIAYPEIFRQMLSKILLELVWSEEDGDSDWQDDWIRFTKNLGGIRELPKEDDKEGREEWIDEAVSMFGRREQLCSVWNREHDSEGQR